MRKVCKQCSAPFEITDEDLVFYEQISPIFNGTKELVPPPTLCPNCRMQRRMTWRNDRTLHHRKSDLSGKQIISMYSADKPYKVYDQDEWWSDQWDALEYGREFDFSKTFMEQFDTLSRDVPHVSLYATNAENSYYTNHTLNMKNCYLIGGGGNSEDCLYGRFIVGCKDTVDGASLYGCEWCYEGIASQECYQCLHFTYCRHCVECVMVEDCTNCKNCIGCFGLTGKEYCIFNVPMTKEEYERRKQELMPLTAETIRLLREKLYELKAKLPHKYAHIFNSEDCSGDMIFNSRQCKWCFDCTDCEESKHIAFTPKGIHSQDATFTAPDGVKWCYEVGSTVGGELCFATHLMWYGSNILYSTECHYCKDCFGCVGLRNKQYCIFNKQYTKEGYESLVSNIIDHMRTTGEWGEFFPVSGSRYCYNESVAHDYFPLTKKDVLQRGWHWHDGQDSENRYMGPRIKAPATILETDDSIVNQILICEITGKPYKITPQELKFYRTIGLPVPRISPDQRHKERMALRNPRNLWKRTCAKCSKEIETTYALERPEIIYCEECYLKTAY